MNYVPYTKLYLPYTVKQIASIQYPSNPTVISYPGLRTT